MSEHFESGVFPDIPYIRPSEGDDTREENYYVEEKGDAYGESMPASGYDSVQLMDRYTPETIANLAPKIKHLLDSQQVSPERFRSALFVESRDAIRHLSDHPEALVENFDYLDEIYALATETEAAVDTEAGTEATNDAEESTNSNILSQEHPSESIAQASSALKSQIIRETQRLNTVEDAEYSDEQIDSLFEAIVTSSHKEVAEQYLNLYLTSRTNIEDAVHTLYAFSEYALKSGSEEHIKQALKILTFGSSVMQATDITSQRLLSAEYIDNDRTLQEQNEIDIFIDHLAPIYLGTEEYQEFRESLQFIPIDLYKETVTNMRANSQARFEAIREYNDRNVGAVNAVPEDKIDQFPYNIFVSNVGPVSEEVQALRNKYSPEARREGMQTVCLPGKTAMSVEMTSERKRVLEDAYYAALQDKGPIESGETDAELNPLQTKTLLEIIYPEDQINSEIIGEMFRQNNELKHEIQEDKERSISQRGVALEVTMPFYAENLGFKTIDFYRSDAGDLANKGAVSGKINVGEYYVNFSVDARGNVKTNAHETTLGPANMFFEQFVLVHLHEVLCFKEEDLLQEMDQTEKKEFENDSKRSEHRRHLPAGHKPTLEQMKLAQEKGWGHLESVNRDILIQALTEAHISVPNMESLNQYELRELAQANSLADDLRLYTYVSETPYTEEELTKLSPLKIRSNLARIFKELREEEAANGANTEISL